MKTAKEMKDTLRYKHMVARLKGLAPYQKGAALMQEISKGKQWRIDAALDAIQPADWSHIDTGMVMKHAAQLGRLQTIDRISDTLGFEKGENPSPQVQAAFHVASLHGNFKTADALAARGARPHYKALDGTPPALFTAIEEGNIRKINYLAKTGAPVGYMAYVATVMQKTKALAHLVANRGATLDFVMPSGDTPLKAAIRGGDPAIIDFVKKYAPKEPAVTDEQLKGTKFETNFSGAHLALLQDTWHVSDITPQLKDVLKGVEKKDSALSLLLKNGREVEWNANDAGGTGFIGRHDRSAPFEMAEARAVIAAAASSGLKSIDVHGDDDQKGKLWIEAQRQGLTVANFTPAEGSIAAWVWKQETAPKAKPPAPPAGLR